MRKFFALMLALIMTLSLVACGSNSSPEPTVTKFCDALKAFDMETASACFVSTDNAVEDPYAEGNEEALDIFTEQAIEYLKSRAKEMTYVIGESTIDGDKATVPVTFTYVDASPVISAALADYMTQAFALAFSGADDSILETLFGTIFIEKTESVSTATTTSTIEFECIKQENEWKIQSLTDSAQYEITNIMSCNLSKAFDAFADSFNEEIDDDTGSDEEYVWFDVPAGQVLELATIKMAITGCEEANELTADYFEPAVAQEGTKFVVLTVEIENITKSTLDLTNDFLLYDNQGREFRPFEDASWYFDEAFVYAQLAPNIKTTGNFVYHVPSDAQGYYLTTAKSGTNEAYCLYAQ